MAAILALTIFSSSPFIFSVFCSFAPSTATKDAEKRGWYHGLRSVRLNWRLKREKTERAAPQPKARGTKSVIKYHCSPPEGSGVSSEPFFVRGRQRKSFLTMVRLYLLSLRVLRLLPAFSIVVLLLLFLPPRVVCHSPAVFPPPSVHVFRLVHLL